MSSFICSSNLLRVEAMKIEVRSEEDYSLVASLFLFTRPRPSNVKTMVWYTKHAITKLHSNKIVINEQGNNFLAPIWNYKVRLITGMWLVNRC
jgi:hypothetical protein